MRTRTPATGESPPESFFVATAVGNSKCRTRVAANIAQPPISAQALLQNTYELLAVVVAHDEARGLFLNG